MQRISCEVGTEYINIQNKFLLQKVNVYRMNYNDFFFFLQIYTETLNFHWEIAMTVSFKMEKVDMRKSFSFSWPWTSDSEKKEPVFRQDISFITWKWLIIPQD
jgi:hypothetical protein